MSIIDLYPNAAVRIMFRRCKPIAVRLINKANQAPPFAAHPRTIASSPIASSPPFSHTMNKDSSVGSFRHLEAIYRAKWSLRSKMRKGLKNIDPIHQSEEDNAIQSFVLEAPWFKASKSLCAYISCASLREVDTSRIVSEVLSSPAKEGNARSRKKLYVPRVEDKNSNMRMLKITSADDLLANSMNILEPTLVDSDGNQREDVMQANEPVDLFILPGIAFDRSGRRLGRGGGYYDMFLKKYQDHAKEHKWKPPILVALSYSLQIMEEGAIPITPGDVPVDAVVSPAGIISPAAIERCIGMNFSCKLCKSKFQ